MSWVIGFIILAVDQITKALIHQGLPYGGVAFFHSLLGVQFSIVYMANKGAAWGAFANFQLPLLAFRILFIIGLFVYALRFNRHPSWRIPLAMVLAGAVGNVTDYFLYGHVVDMLHFVLWGYSFPVFNVADSSIFLGVCTLFFLSRKT